MEVKTPDLQGELGSIKVLCEVKTINIYFYARVLTF